MRLKDITSNILTAYDQTYRSQQFFIVVCAKCQTKARILKEAQNSYHNIVVHEVQYVDVPQVGRAEVRRDENYKFTVYAWRGSGRF